MEAKARKLWRERGFYRLLDRMLFRAARPDQRYRILQRFYALDERLIERFYAARSSGYDRRSEEHTSELQSLMRISYAVFCLKKKIHEHLTSTKLFIHPLILNYYIHFNT